VKREKWAADIISGLQLGKMAAPFSMEAIDKLKTARLSMEKQTLIDKMGNLVLAIWENLEKTKGFVIEEGESTYPLENHLFALFGNIMT
jgi:hypothetical protein